MKENQTNFHYDDEEDDFLNSQNNSRAYDEYFMEEERNDEDRFVDVDGMSYYEYLIQHAPDSEYRRVIGERDNYLASLSWELRRRGIHPREAQNILSKAFRTYFSGFRDVNFKGNTRLDDDRDRINRFFNNPRRP